jgi:hypothetical protein
MLGPLVAAKDRAVTLPSFWSASPSSSFGNTTVTPTGLSGTPFVPFVPFMGVLVCTAMILGEGWVNWTRLLIWLGIGFVIYFGYGRKHSRLAGTSAET